MRTTLAIDDSVLEEAKRTAESRGITLGELVTDTLRAAMRETDSHSAARYRAVTWGKPGDLVTDAAAIARLLTDDDQDLAGAPLRKRKARRASR
jgi:hypothetical protein